MRAKTAVWMALGGAGLCLGGPVAAQAPASGPASGGQVQYTPAPPAAAQPQGPMTAAEMRELLDAARETAKATREAVDYSRVVPDILTQILAKLDKIENKLDKIELVLKGQGGGQRRR